MATLQRIARIVLSQAGGTRTIEATAAQLDSVAGSGVSISVSHTTTGLTPPSEPTALNFQLRTDSGVTLRTIDLPLPASGTPSTFTVYLTPNGSSNGDPRAGTYELVLYAQRTATGTYEVSSSGTPNTTSVGITSATDRGWIRGTTTMSLSVSNVGAGGVKNEPAAYTSAVGSNGGDSLYIRGTLGHPAMNTKSFTAGVSGVVSGTLSINSSATVGDMTISQVVDDRFPAALSTQTVDVLTVALSGLSGEPWTVLTAVTTDSIQVDPRVTVDHHMQFNEDDFATPPGSLDAISKDRMSNDMAFVGFRLVNARGEGVNGLTVTETLQDVKALRSAAINRSVVTQAMGGQDGWVPSWGVWDQQLPPGAWTHTVAITTTDADALEVNPTETFTLLAVNAAIAPVVSGGPVNKGEHVYAGGHFQGGISLLNTQTGKRVPITSAAVALIRLNDANGHAQYLEADNVTWTTITSTATTIHFHAVTETVPVGSATNPSGSNVFLKTWLPEHTTTWGEYDLFVVGRAKDETGTTYGAAAKEPVVGPHHKHSTEEAAAAASAPVLDAIQLALHGVIGQR